MLLLYISGCFGTLLAIIVYMWLFWFQLCKALALFGKVTDSGLNLKLEKMREKIHLIGEKWAFVFKMRKKIHLIGNE